MSPPYLVFQFFEQAQNTVRHEQRDQNEDQAQCIQPEVREGGSKPALQAIHGEGADDGPDQ